MRPRTRWPMLCLVVAAIASCSERVPKRGVVARLATASNLAPLDSSAREAMLGPTTLASGCDEVLTLDGRSEWRYFLVENEMTLGSTLVPRVEGESLDDARRRIGSATLTLPYFTGAAYPLALDLDVEWVVEVEGSFGAESKLAASIAFFSDAHPPWPDTLEPGAIRSRMFSTRVGQVLLTPPATGTTARQVIRAPEGARSSLLLVSSHSARAESVERVRVLAKSPYSELLAARSMDDDGIARVSFGDLDAPSLVVPPGATRESREIELPTNPRLSCVVRALTSTRTAPATLRIEVRSDGRSLVSRSETLGGGESREIALDLKEFGGRKVVVRFSTDRGAVAIGAPAIDGERDVRGDVLVLAISAFTRQDYDRARAAGSMPSIDWWSQRVASPSVPPAFDVSTRFEEFANSGLRVAVFAPADSGPAVAIADRFVRGDVVADRVEASSLPATSIFRSSLDVLEETEAPPAALLWSTLVVSHARTRGDASQLAAALQAVDRFVGDLARFDIDRGTLDSTTLVLLGEESGIWIPLLVVPSSTGD